MSEIANRLADIHRTLDRYPSHPSLIAVSKTQPDDKIVDALNAGQRIFGENRVQEAVARWQDRRTRFPDLELHLIGPLQTNKVRAAVALFDVIHTVDRPRLVEALVQECRSAGRFPRCLIQVNTGDESTKSGISLSGLPDLLDFCRASALPIDGLMCIPPQDEPAGLHFALLRKLALRHGLRHLSMGMSADWKLAAALGATYVRIGSAVFGPREEKADITVSPIS